MSLLQSFRNLSPSARMGVGLGLLAWGAIGLHMSDRAEERYGLKATEEDKAALAKVVPRITVVDREEKDDGGSGSGSGSGDDGGN
ncbi:hypothetical protein F4804DRAFT_299110 [Jackrogersella minutella]|nr:hypothetical protein F4804DRAFT_299110 [Jackrogersella minutella]